MKLTLTVIGCYSLLVYLGLRAHQQYRDRFKPFRWELLDLREVLLAALASGERDAKVKIEYVVGELRKLT